MADTSVKGMGGLTDPSEKRDAVSTTLTGPVAATLLHKVCSLYFSSRCARPLPTMHLIRHTL